MNFSTLINTKIMPEVKSGSDEPVIIYRDSYGDWHGDHTQNQYGEEFEWVGDVRGNSLFTITVRGLDFNKKGYTAVYDKIFLEKLLEEYYYYDYESIDEKYDLILNFIEENIGDFPSEVTDYLIDLEKPLAEIVKIIPPDLQSDIFNHSYDEETTNEIISHFEKEIENRLNNRDKNHDDKTEKRTIDGYEERLVLQLGGKFIVLAENPEEPGLYLVCNITRDNPFGIEERHDVLFTDDYLEALRQFTSRVDTTVENLRYERHQAGLLFRTLTAANCIPNSAGDDFEGKLIVIKPEVLTPEYRSAEHQLKYCRGGNGANPNARGSAVFCKDFYSGKESRFERWDVAGVADMKTLPAWVDQKIKLEEAIKEPGVFQYGGKHFKPVRQFKKGEIDKRLEGDSRPWKQDAQYAMRNMSSDFELGISNSAGKAEWSHDAFYAASGNSQCDIFRCVENGKLYVPGANELFRYSEPPKRAKAEKPSLADRIEKGKEKVREADKNKAKPDKPKNKNKGVDD